MTLKLIKPRATPLSRVEAVTSLVLLAGTAAASLRGSVKSEHDQRQAALLEVALHEALGELRLVAIDLAQH